MPHTNQQPMSWIQHPLILEDKNIRLIPLAENHFDELIGSSQDETIWTYMPVKGNQPELLKAALSDALSEFTKQEQYPFAVFHKASGKIIGCTRFLKLNPMHKSLEIGWTWYLPEYWGTGVNEACKYLLLTYCFEVLQTIRVQIIASDKNLGSRKAIEKIGASFEGILRNMVIRNNEKRSVAFYSIIDTEWPTVKQTLEQRLNNRVNP